MLEFNTFRPPINPAAVAARDGGLETTTARISKGTPGVTSWNWPPGDVDATNTISG
jgi:hypothetical protein